MRLAELVTYITTQKVAGSLEVEITGLAQDSRTVEAGNLFFCIQGSHYDGHKYLAQAAARGAVAAIVERWPENDLGLTIILVPEVPRIIKEVAGAFFDYPDRKLQLIGVVGTNGKTTSTYLVKSILEAAGYQVGLIGTIANMIRDQALETHNTTPGVLDLQKLFAQMVKARVQYVVMEVSSHSIDQGRVAGLSFRSGIFTNITQDHLDYHGTFDEYLRVKSKFFTDLSQMAWAVLNLDDPHTEKIMAKTVAKVLTYGIDQPAMVKAEQIQIDHSGGRFSVTTPQGNLTLNLKLTGYFNVYNCLGAMAAALSLGIDLQTIQKGLESVSGVPGRFEVVPGPQPFGVIVDYAHTPDGLENILKTGRKLTTKKLLLAFGCGGDRDRTKRPIMGALAAKMADLIIITSDNPRSEDPESIVSEIETGLKQANPNAKYLLEVDRAQAIKKIIDLARDGDLVLIAGKGHENYQEFNGGQRIYFDDREIAIAALKEKFDV